MKELIITILVMVFSIFIYINFQILNIVLLLILIIIFFIIITKDIRILYIFLSLIFYIYLSIVTYNSELIGIKSLYVKFDGRIGTVLRVENKYINKKILVNNTKYPYGYYKILYQIKDKQEKNGIIIIKGKILEAEDAKSNIYRKKLLDILDKIFIDEYSLSAFAKAAILGEKAGIENEFNEMFKNTGLSHLIVISGLHIGLIIIIFLKIFENVIFSYRLKYIFTWILLTIYCLIVGFSVSVLRTYITGSIMVLAKIFFEEQDSKKSLLISMIITLVLMPYSIFDISFQLSYGAVISILFIFPIFEKIYIIKFKIKDMFLDYLFKTALLSLVIQLLTMPVFLYNFKTLPIFSFMCNIIGIPLGTLIIQMMFFLILFNVFGLELLNGVFVFIIKIVFNSFETIIYFMNKIPLLQIIINMEIHWFFIIVYYILMFIILYYLNRLKIKPKVKIEKL